MAGEQQQHQGRRVVLFPLPFQGHLSPMLQLAAVLHGRGFAITVLYTTFNAPDPARHPHYRFVPIHETLPAAAVWSDDIAAQLVSLNESCEEPFRAALALLMLPTPTPTPQEPPVACAVVDGQWYAMLRAAKQLGFPALALRTDSAATFRCMLAYPRLRDAGYVPIKSTVPELDAAVPELPPLRVRDLIRVDGGDVDALCDFIASVGHAMRTTAAGVVLNTFDAIEAAEVAEISHELSLPAFAIGPLHSLSPTTATATENVSFAADRSCLRWLDTQPPRSVLYVSLGSIACICRGEFEEMAWGLANSGVPFLWVVRPGSVRTEEAAKLPEKLDEAIENRGHVIDWAPQREVLAHEAIGGFWTHCGWNSTLESICEGVPMLCQPRFADQTVNARYATYQWGVGLEAAAAVKESGSIEMAVRRLMRGEEGARAEEKVLELKKRVSLSVCIGGSSRVALDNLVDFILSL